MPNLNPSQLSDNIAADLFGGGEATPPPESEGGGESLSPPATPPSDPTPSLAVDQIPAPPPPSFTMPKSWKKEKEAVWSKLDPAAQEYITLRENDVLKGFEQYSKGHNSWREVTGPFEQILSQNPDVNPVQLMQTLVRNHLAIVQASPEQRQELAMRLLQGYGINLPAAGAQGGQPQSQQNPEVQRLQAEIRQMQQALQGFTQAQYQSAVQEQTKLIEAFAKDPKNKYFDEVGQDILRFIQTGAANDLPTAYELACYANPAVRAKIIAEQTAANTPPVDKPVPPPVNGSGEGTPSRRKPATIEDTIASVVQKHYGTH